MSEYVRFLIVLSTLLLSLTATHAKPSVEAAWQDGSVSIDGSAEEWTGTMTYFEAPGLHLGARSDDEFLYLCLYSVDPKTGRSALHRGLIVTFEGNLTIQFPMGMESSGRSPMHAGSGPPDPEQMRQQAMESLGEGFLLESGSSGLQHVSLDNHLGIEMRVATEPDFVYELKVPLVQTEIFPYAIEASPGDKIVVRLNAPETDQESMGGPAGGRGGGMGGGMGGGRGGMGGGRGGMGGGMGGGRGGGMGGGMDGRPSRPDPIQLKAKIRLAPPPDQPE